MMTCSIIEKVSGLWNDSDGTALTFFYCDGNGKEKKESRYILRSIFRQLLEPFCADSKHPLRARLEQFYRANKYRSLRASELVAWIKSISQTFKMVSIIIDGLDECSMPSEIASLLVKCSAPNIRILATSRPAGEICDEFSKLPQMELDYALVQADIDTYIDSHLTHDRGLQKIKSSFKTEIKEKLLKESQGM